MKLTTVVVVCGALLMPSVGRAAQGGGSLESALNGKEVVLKLDMPGSQKGVDLRFDKPSPMNWKEYGSRIKEYGIAIRKGDTARITSVVRKNDMIEVQLNGGGFGTIRDDTRTTVEYKPETESDYEKSLEKQISETDDYDKKRDLQRDLDRERARRERSNDAKKRDADIASAARAEQVASDRAGGGSRFNLRWSGKIPVEADSAEGVEQLLAGYVSFDGSGTGGASARSSTDGMGSASGSPAATGQLRQGMTMDDVAGLLGQGKQTSETTANGMSTQVMTYVSGERQVEVTYVNGVVVRFVINSK